ncbi:DUF4834 domain-containing protein [Mucilaginibacter phyllosphaerae]|uniref:DUF4834 domain-containing protein n=1 Tax=Mucilaginibacter phyllosphaerae TaxID=1812349 RepID=A0A4Y8ABI7_9SPHI|nr:DUF4834 domain-containing protein [Mucilaginibacter phyllosphaerae]MBB3969844.1 hypothetical protein [Mucilaginibacter phyllosphaerae]TEW65219.1 DUF4834 domain-containing protein [Mucilaginibacter phyllosphaerae]GGH17202.1 hypothetical protein GCM10007352_27170 [Mucilaginibacter phyllosphaerae]
MGVLIRFLIITICSLYIIRALVRLFLPMLFNSVINKAQEQARQQNNYQQPKPDGRVRVDYKPEAKSAVPDSEGEFVDYEEIK